MAFPRVTAILFLLLLIGSLSFLSISALVMLNPIHMQTNQIEHIEGRIVAMQEGAAGIDFILETAAGRKIEFQCDNACHTSLGHIQRHMLEHAVTDVYYVKGPDKRLLALNVD